METLILGWYVLVETGSVLLLTLFASLTYIGTLIAPMFGVVGDRIDLRIIDRGCGIPLVQRDRLFEPFQRLHTIDEFEGNGIGLAIVHRIVTRHGGRIWANSVPGKATVFRFALAPGGGR